MLSSGNRPRSYNATNTTNLIKLIVNVNRKRIKALLDSGSQANYISRKALFEARLQPY
jgi:UDP-glucose 4-epimerase